MNPVTTAVTPSQLMGASVKRKEDRRLITGTATYVTDVAVPGMLHVAFVRSPHAHARVGAIDTSAALERPGVRLVLTGADIKKHAAPIPPGGSAGEGGGGDGEATVGRQHYALSIDRVRHVGEPVAAIVAETAAIAEDAVNDVVVDWQPLPAVVDMFQAMKPGAPQLHESAANNIEHRNQIKSGDPDGVFAKAKTVVKVRMNSQRLSGVAMEPRACVAAPDGATGGLVVWTSHQAPHNQRADLAATLGLPPNMIRVVVPEMGGGFGVKFGCHLEDVVCAVIARVHRVAVRWAETRVESMMATTHGRDQVTELEAAVEPDGRVAALRMRVTANIGAYPVFTFIPDLTLMMGVGTYKFTDVDLQSTLVFTNTTSVAAYRGAGRPEAAYYLERLMDVIAYDLTLEPEQVRRVNFIPPDAFPYKTPTGHNYDSGEYDRALTRALEISGYAKLRREQKERRERKDRVQLGIGMACYVEMCGFGPFESAVVRVDPAGTVTAYTGTSPHGQGHETTFAQIIADNLGVDFDRVVVRHGDTAALPQGNGTGGSRSLAVGGSAIMGASLKVQEKARRIAAHMLEASFEDIVLADGKYQVRGAPAKGLGLAQIAATAYGEGLPKDIESGLEATDFFRPPQLVYPFGAHVAVVEADTETGAVTLRAYYSVDDCGVRITPNLVEGQVHGGLAQGIAQALWEEVVYTPEGQLTSGSLMDYAIPRAEDLPPFTTDQTVTRTPFNPLGAKGIGEAATIGSTPATVNAIADAFRVRDVDMPVRYGRARELAAR